MVQDIGRVTELMKKWFRRVLFGADGLRPGWRVLVFFLVFAGLVICTLPLFKHLPRIHSPSGMLPWPAALSEGVLVALVVLATAALVRLVDRRPWGVDGMPLKRAFGGKFWIGVLIGIGTLTVQLLVMRAVGVFEFGTLELHGYEALRSAAAWAVFSVLTAIFEQVLLRGYAQRALTDAIGFWPAALALSCLFAALHLVNAGENKFGIVAVVLVGMFTASPLWGCFTASPLLARVISGWQLDFTPLGTGQKLFYTVSPLVETLLPVICLHPEFTEALYYLAGRRALRAASSLCWRLGSQQLQLRPFTDARTRSPSNWARR